MSFPVLQQYLSRLSHATGAASSIWLADDGRAVGRFFNCTMSSAFQPVRRIDTGVVAAYEGRARSVAAADQGLSLWKLLDHAASDDESIELDRLCRMLHAINFFRQADDGEPDLYLNVHDRLLSAVSSNHGDAFRRILDALELPLARVVLQLPAATPQQGWLLNYVADNYRRNGFRFAVHAGSAREALDLLGRVWPDVCKLDARVQHDEASLMRLLTLSAEAGSQVVFKRLESPRTLVGLRALAASAGTPMLAQGNLLDTPQALLQRAQPPALAAAAW